MPRRQFFRWLLIIQSLCLVFVMLPTPEARAVEPHVYISEVAWAGSSLSTADEWLELANPTHQTIALGGWRLTGAGANNKPLVLPADAAIPAGGAYLIANYSASDAHCALVIEPNVVSTTVSLPNDKLLIRLWNSSGDSVDQAGDGNAPPAGYSGANKASMIRIDFNRSGDQAAAWKTADSSPNLKTSDLGTPGFVDIVPTTTISQPIEQPIEQETDTAANDATSTVSATSTTEIPIDVTTTSTESTTTTIDQAVLPPDETESEEILASDTSSSTDTFATTSTTPDQPEVTDAQATDTPSFQFVTTTLAATTTDDLSSVRLNELMPDPQAGTEWVELTSSDPGMTISLDKIELHDASGKIAALSGTLSPALPYYLYQLHSSRLNNDGDTISLRTSDGQIIDTFTYNGSHKGLSWARDAQETWQETLTPTPGYANTITTNQVTVVTVIANQTQNTAPMETVVAAPKTATKSATKKSSTTAKTKTVASTKAADPAKANVKTTTKKTAAVTKALTEPTTQTKTIQKAAVAKKASATKKLSGTKPKIQSSINLDFDMLQDDSYGGMRIKLQGTVGSIPKLVAGRALILLNPEGRGILVKLPANRKALALGTRLSLTGTLKFDTRDFPYLSLSKTDEWTILNRAAASSTPREVMWQAPAAEDAWCLVSATGTIINISGQTLALSIDGADAELKIKPGIGYQVSQLRKGDIIQAMGILDITGDKPVLLPRSSDEIKLVSHVAEKIEPVKSQPVPGLPGWTPFGAALGAIGAVEGVKKLKTRKKDKAKVVTA